LALLSVAADVCGGVVSIWDLGMGARPLAMGEAFVGLADDENAVLRNPAGLAWGDGLSILSSAEVRPSTAGCGHLTVCVNNFGLGLHYFDFGDIPETDESGNVIGAFSYSNMGLIASVGLAMANIPLLSSIQLAEYMAFGIGVKLFSVDTLEPGDGSGIATDLSFLLRVDDPWFGSPSLSRLAFGVVAQNLLGSPIAYESGHHEDWLKRVSLGISVTTLDHFTASLEVGSTQTVHVGFEWSPVAVLAVRCGLKRDGLWMWSLGTGVELDRLAIEYALVLHPYLLTQHRASLRLAW